MKKVLITGVGSISPLGRSRETIAASYRSRESAIIYDRELAASISKISPEDDAAIDAMKNGESRYAPLDRTAHLAMFAGAEALRGCSDHDGLVISFGSSRGATERFEHYFEKFRRGERISAHTSPVTTLGNISSWVGQSLGVDAAMISHSATCSTALQSIANGVAWIRSGMAKRFLAGGSEAPLTPFTIAQMRALGIYSSEDDRFPCKPCHAAAERRNTFVLGEGACAFLLEDAEYARSAPLAVIEGAGFALESISHGAAISEEGEGLARSMQRALESSGAGAVDALVLHAPGTVRGDRAELQAINDCFGEARPWLVSNKWRIGHTLGAAGAFGLEYALELLHSGASMEFPYAASANPPGKEPPRQVKRIMVNAAGFGGLSGSVIISRP